MIPYVHLNDHLSGHRAHGHVLPKDDANPMEQNYYKLSIHKDLQDLNII